MSSGGSKGTTVKSRKRLDPKDYRFIKLRNETVCKSSGEINGQSFILDDLVNCNVILGDMSGQVTVDDCKDSMFVIGPVKGSFFLRNCHNCHITVACRQFRCVNSSNCVVRLLCQTDAPVIESSTYMTFLPWNVGYPNLLTHLQNAGFDKNVNYCKHIYDFTVEEQPDVPHAIVSEEYTDEYRYIEIKGIVGVMEDVPIDLVYKAKQAIDCKEWEQYGNLPQKEDIYMDNSQKNSNNKVEGNEDDKNMNSSDDNNNSNSNNNSDNNSDNKDNNSDNNNNNSVESTNIMVETTPNIVEEEQKQAWDESTDELITTSNTMMNSKDSEDKEKDVNNNNIMKQEDVDQPTDKNVVTGSMLQEDTEESTSGEEEYSQTDNVLLNINFEIVHDDEEQSLDHNYHHVRNRDSMDTSSQIIETIDIENKDTPHTSDTNPSTNEDICVVETAVEDWDDWDADIVQSSGRDRSENVNYGDRNTLDKLLQKQPNVAVPRGSLIQGSNSAPLLSPESLKHEKILRPSKNEIERSVQCDYRKNLQFETEILHDVDTHANTPEHPSVCSLSMLDISYITCIEDIEKIELSRGIITANSSNSEIVSSPVANPVVGENTNIGSNDKESTSTDGIEMIVVSNNNNSNNANNTSNSTKLTNIVLVDQTTDTSTNHLTPSSNSPYSEDATIDNASYQSCLTIITNEIVSKPTKPTVIRKDPRKRSIFDMLCGCLAPSDFRQEDVASRDMTLFLAVTPFQNSCMTHWDLVQSIYTNITNETVTEKEGAHWEFIGFQGSNPLTDLRGTGMLGALHLSYLSEKYPYIIQTMHAYNIQNKDKVLPLAISCINITALVIQWLRTLEAIQFRNSKIGQTYEHVIHMCSEVYVAAVSCMFQKWMDKKYTIAAFSKVKKEVQDMITKNITDMMNNVQQTQTQTTNHTHTQSK